MRVLAALLLLPAVALGYVSGPPSEYLINWNPPVTAGDCDIVLDNTVARIDIENAMKANRVTCLSPGTSVTSIRVIGSEFSGKPGAPRVLALVDGTLDHPASMTPETSATTVQLEVRNTEYVYFHRITLLNTGGSSSHIALVQDAEHIVFDRIYAYDIPNGISILQDSHWITMQRGFYGPMREDGNISDNVCIETINEPSGNNNTPETMRIQSHIHIVDNEMRDCNDAIQPVMRSDEPARAEWASNPDFVVDGNTIWFQDRVDKDGNPDPEGLYKCGENWVDYKTGSRDPNWPMKYTNNLMFQSWGIPHGASALCGSAGGGGYLGFFGHFDAPNVVIENNFLGDNGSAFSCTTKPDASVADYACSEHVIKGNYFWEYNRDLAPLLADGATNLPSNHISRMDDSKTMAIVGNYFHGNEHSINTFRIGNNAGTRQLEDSLISCNVIYIANQETIWRYYSDTVTFQNNLWVDAGLPTNGSGDPKWAFPDQNGKPNSSVFEASVTPGDWEDVSWQYNVYTGNPDTYTAVGSKPTQQLLDRLPIACRVGPSAPGNVQVVNNGSSATVSWDFPTLRSDGSTAFDPAVEVWEYVVEMQTDRGQYHIEKVPSGTGSRDINVDTLFPTGTAFAMQVRVKTTDNAMLADSAWSAWVPYDHRVGALAAPSSFAVAPSGTGITASWAFQTDPVTIQQYNPAFVRWDDLRTVTSGTQVQIDTLGPVDGEGKWEIRAVSDRFDTRSSPTPTQEVTP